MASFMMKLWFIISSTVLLAGCGNEEESESSSSHLIGEEEISSAESEQVVLPEKDPLEQMTLEEKVGQLFLARLPDIEALEMAQNYHLGGYIWFAKDFSEKQPEQVQEEVSALQEASPYGMFMAVDEEGGDVIRISSFSQYRSEPFPSPQEEFQLNGWEGIEERAEEKASLLKELGFNLNLAPVADVPTAEEDFIYSRSFSTDPTLVSQFVETEVTQFKEGQVGTVLKHFPGYGNNVDTHVGVAYDDRVYETFLERDFLPFQAGIEAGTEGILVAHNVIKAIDPTLPATLSPAVIQLLRVELAFEGLIITDDLVMEGLQAFADPEEAAVLAVLAGNDLLISSDFTIQMAAVLEAVEEGRITEARIDESVRRILHIKKELGILPEE